METSVDRPPSQVFSAAFAEVLTHHGAEVGALGMPQPWAPIAFYRAFAQVRRHLPATELSLSEAHGAHFAVIYPGFHPGTWSLPAMARAWLMHQVPEEAQPDTFRRLLRHAEIGEQIAIYRALYTLSDPRPLAAQVAEGVRTNMVSVFDAIALHNPVAPWLLDDVGWRQLVLKAVFMGRPLHRIHRLDARATPELARAAHDYAHERWAAGRPISPELWRLMRGTTDADLLEDLARAAAEPGLASRAARLALAPAPDDQAAWAEIGIAVEDADATSSAPEPR